MIQSCSETWKPKQPIHVEILDTPPPSLVEGCRILVDPPPHSPRPRGMWMIPYVVVGCNIHWCGCRCVKANHHIEKWVFYNACSRALITAGLIRSGWCNVLEDGLFVPVVVSGTALHLRLQNMSTSFETKTFHLRDYCAKNSEIISRLLERKPISSINLALILEQQ